MKLEAANAAPDSWERRTVGEACARITSGGTPSRRVPSFYEQGTVPWVKTKELNDGVILETEELITELALDSSSAKLLPPGTILLAMYGATVGMLGVLGKPMACNQACCALIPGANTDRDYLYYQLLAHRQQLQGLATGAAQQNLSGAQIKQLVLPFPSLDEQRSIGRTLRILDDRITLLRETNATLEAIAQALFKSWFVDFDPVRAKMAGHPPEGMDAATAALFPDTLEESELGLVPKGWRFGTIGDFAQLKRGSVNPGRQPDVVFEHYSLPAFDNERCPVVELGEAIKSNKTPVSSDAVLLSKLNPHIPRIWMPVHCGINAICSTEFLVFQPVGVGSKELIYCTFSSPDFLVRLQHLVTGTSNSHQRIKPDQVALMSSIVPPKEIARQFEVLMKPIFEKVHANGEQARSLASLRDTLLPRLISGQLRLPEAQALVGELTPSDSIDKHQITQGSA